MKSYNKKNENGDSDVMESQEKGQIKPLSAQNFLSNFSPFKIGTPEITANTYKREENIYDKLKLITEHLSEKSENKFKTYHSGMTREKDLNTFFVSIIDMTLEQEYYKQLTPNERKFYDSLTRKEKDWYLSFQSSEGKKAMQTADKVIESIKALNRKMESLPGLDF